MKANEFKVGTVFYPWKAIHPWIVAKITKDGIFSHPCRDKILTEYNSVYFDFNELERASLETKFEKILRETSESGEPVFLLRAKDALALKVINAYIGMSLGAGCKMEFIDEIIKIAKDFEDWRISNTDKIRIPD